MPSFSRFWISAELESVSAGLKQAIARATSCSARPGDRDRPIPRSRIAKQSLRERNSLPRQQVDSQFANTRLIRVSHDFSST